MIANLFKLALLAVLLLYFPLFFFSALTGVDLHHALGGQPTSLR